MYLHEPIYLEFYLKVSHLLNNRTPAVPVIVCALAIFILSGMDAAMKTLVIAVGVYNVVLWRSVLATLVAGSIWFSGTWVWPKWSVLKLHILRSATVAVVLLTFFWGLAKLPLADAIGLSFIAPLLALILAAVILGERIRIQAIWATLAGMVGVAFILGGQFVHVQYSTETMQGTLAVLLSTVFYAYNLILARKQAQLAKPTEIMFFQSMLLSIYFLLPAPWLAVRLATEHWLLLVVVTALSLSGQFLMSWSYARAEAQYLIPTEYSAFVWAILFGWIFFNEGVVWTTLIGAVLIIVGCLIAARSNSKLSEPIEATI
jgi:S-adenosylmethionine uptake transporter